MPFDGDAGKKPGLEIWRIEKLDVARVDPSTYGTFYSGDSYIVLKTNQKPGRSSLEWDIHYWIGKESSQDEQGVCAYKTVELDDLLGGGPVQHREVQEYESGLFMSYFPKGIKYQEGGIESGFRHVDPSKYEPRLFHIKGKRNVRCTQVALAAQSLNDGDVFILDCGLTLYQWNGKESNKYEKFKGLEIITKIKDAERGGKAKLIFLDSGVNDTDVADFWTVLKGSHANVQSASAAGSDDDVGGAGGKHDKANVVLFSISDASGSLEIKELARGSPFDKALLNPNDVFLLDTGGEVFCWIGKGATAEERKRGMEYGVQYLKTNNRPHWTPLTRIPGTGEPPVFKSYFRNFDAEPAATAAAAAAGGAGSSSEPKEKKLEMSGLYAKKRGADADEDGLLKDGELNGSLQIFRIEKLAKQPLPAAEYGHFYSGDSYIVLYTYTNKNGKEAYIIYYWQGRDSSIDERATSAYLAVELDQQYGNAPVQVRVAQGKEPPSFLRLFKGAFVVHDGGVDSGFKNRQNAEAEAPAAAAVRLYQVKSRSSVNVKATQVAPVATSLNSGDCFIFVHASQTTVWEGKGANADERACAARLGAALVQHAAAGTAGAVAHVAEGSESDDFWALLGGRAEYATALVGADDVEVESRLFSVNQLNKQGQFQVEEIYNFTQDDLTQDAVYLLDNYYEIYVWLGNDARKEDKDAALTMALRYVSSAPDGRSSDTPVYRVFAGNEPSAFTAAFLGWDDKKASDFADPYVTRLQALKLTKDDDATAPTAAAAASSSSSSSAAAAAAPAPAASPKAERVTSDMIGYAAEGSVRLSLAELKAKTKEELATLNIHPAQKEKYLNDADFEAAFKTSREAFDKLPQWKKDEAKKKVGLF